MGGMVGNGMEWGSEREGLPPADSSIHEARYM